MRKSTKAVLLSAFVFPGIGHFVLKKYLLGAALTGAALAALYVVIVKTVEKALPIAEKIQSGEIQPDAAAIAELLAKQPAGAGDQLINVAATVLVIAWLIGIVDSFRVGRVKDKEIEAGG